MAPPAPVAEAPPAETLEEGFPIQQDARPAEPLRHDLLGSATYDLPIEANPWVQMEVDYLTGPRRTTLGRWMERAERYQAWVQEVFASYGLPRDLHHLAMVESGYTPTARSRAGALGMWQFMPATGRGMGLRVDELVDERMDPVRSTHAAARHLRDLHRAFAGDWALAAAAYNAGAGRIGRGMGRYGARDFWDLAVRGDLARETRHYVPRLYAVTIVARDPERFGYPLPSGRVPMFGYDSIRVDVPTPLAELARVSGIPLTQLGELNPHLHRGTAPAHYWVWTPPGTGPLAQAAFDSSSFRREGGYDHYTLRRGERIEDVAQASGLTLEQIQSLNLSRRLDRMGRGDRVRLPAPAVRLLRGRRPESVLLGLPSPTAEPRAARPVRRRETAAEPAPVARADEPAHRSAESPSTEARPRSERSARLQPAVRRRGSHTVAEGETLWAIARRFDVSVPQLRQANSLAEDEPIRPGQSLRIPRLEADGSGGPRESRPAPRANHSRADRTQEEPRSAAASRRDTRGAAQRSHTVGPGDTLWSIARRYETSVEALREANDLEEGEAIRPGQQLRIPGR